MKEILDRNILFIRQKKELMEIIVDFETRNKYEILDEQQNSIGWVIEKGKGFLSTIARIFLKSHRPLDIYIFDNSRKELMHLTRNFFFFFSDLFINAPNKQLHGSIHRRFGILHKKYDLKDRSGNLFATISSPIWKLWTFPVLSTNGKQISCINKKWKGILQEAFTDADTFMINFENQDLSIDKKTIILAAAISIDFDFFEDNSGRGGALNLID